MEDIYIYEDSRVRVFDKNSPDSFFHWHKDLHHRTVFVAECSEGWWFQYDNQIPVELKESMVLEIPKQEYHILFKKFPVKDLKLLIIEDI